MRKLIGYINNEEKNEIQLLSNRKDCLIELLKMQVSENNTELNYEKLMNDMVEVNIAFNQWWNKMGEKYQWENHPEGNWEIDFLTNQIFLVVDNH